MFVHLLLDIDHVVRRMYGTTHERNDHVVASLYRRAAAPPRSDRFQRGATKECQGDPLGRASLRTEQGRYVPGAPGFTTSNKKLLVTKGMSTGSNALVTTISAMRRKC